jgi:hypothetical protein
LFNKFKKMILEKFKQSTNFIIKYDIFIWQRIQGLNLVETTVLKIHRKQRVVIFWLNTRENALISII